MTATIPPPEPGTDWVAPERGHEFIWLPQLRFWVAKHAVANDEFRQFRPAHDSGEFEGATLNDDRQPVANVSYNDALDYCQWLRKRLCDACDRPALVVRLPSHMEWTQIAACGLDKLYPWGNDWPPAYGNYGDQAAKEVFPDWDVIEDYNDGSAVSCPVDEAGENEWGLVGVAGNVYEWTFVAGSDQTELRGGSWSTYQPEYMELRNRLRREPTSRLVNFGFRLLLTV